MWPNSLLSSQILKDICWTVLCFTHTPQTHTHFRCCWVAVFEVAADINRALTFEILMYGINQLCVQTDMLSHIRFHSTSWREMDQGDTHQSSGLRREGERKYFLWMYWKKQIKQALWWQVALAIICEQEKHSQNGCEYSSLGAFLFLLRKNAWLVFTKHVRRPYFWRAYIPLPFQFHVFGRDDWVISFICKGYKRYFNITEIRMSPCVATSREHCKPQLNREDLPRKRGMKAQQHQLANKD